MARRNFYRPKAHTNIDTATTSVPIDYLHIHYRGVVEHIIYQTHTSNFMTKNTARETIHNVHHVIDPGPNGNSYVSGGLYTALNNDTGICISSIPFHLVPTRYGIE